MSSEVEVTGITTMTRPWKISETTYLLAHFDFEARGFRFQGCRVLYSTETGNLFAGFPPVKSPGVSRKNHVRIRDRELWNEVQERMHEAFHMMGGTVPTEAAA